MSTLPSRRPVPVPVLRARMPGLLAALAVLCAMLLASGAAQAKGLPKPHVSPALDAVLMPITAEVRKEFKLGKKAAGAVVVSVDPGGTGELYGLEPGDVITQLDGKIIRRPVDIDSMVRYGLEKGNSYFFFDGTRKNRKKKTIIEIPAAEYSKPVAVDSLPRWRGYNAGGGKGQRGGGSRGSDGYFITGGGGFFYADFCDAYYQDFYEVYDYTLIYVEEIIVTEVFITAYESEETVFYFDEASAGYDWPDDEYYVTEVDEYVYSEEFYAEYTSTEVYYEDEVDEAGFALDEGGYEGAMADEGYVEEPAADDGYVEEPVADEGYVEEPIADEGYVEEPIADEGYVEEPVADEGYVEEPVADEGYVEEPVADEGYVEEPIADEGYVEEPVADEGYVEEPVYEEPAYEEPVYEEPAYEEPAYEEPVYEEPAYEEPVYEEPAGDGGGGCYFDDEGNEICG